MVVLGEIPIKRIHLLMHVKLIGTQCSYASDQDLPDFEANHAAHYRHA